MPELPQVEGLVRFVRAEADGATIAAVEFGSFSALKTVDPPPSALAGLEVTAVSRRGKFIIIEVGGLYFTFHLARAGWLRWHEAMPATPVKPGGQIAMRVTLDDIESSGLFGFDLTEAGKKRRLAVYITRSPNDVPGVSVLGPEPLDITNSQFKSLLRDRHMQIKGLLRDQQVIAGIGNAYSDEILHAARLSPFAMADRLTEDEFDHLYTNMHEILSAAIAAADGAPAKNLKDTKRAGMEVHGRSGETCGVCGDTIREVSFADSSLQYCPTCQTKGKILADRRTSKFLK